MVMGIPAFTCYHMGREAEANHVLLAVPEPFAKPPYFRTIEGNSFP